MSHPELLAAGGMPLLAIAAFLVQCAELAEEKAPDTLVDTIRPAAPSTPPEAGTIPAPPPSWTTLLLARVSAGDERVEAVANVAMADAFDRYTVPSALTLRRFVTKQVRRAASRERARIALENASTIEGGVSAA